MHNKSDLKMDISKLTNKIQHEKELKFLSEFLKIDTNTLSKVYIYIPNAILDISNLSIIQCTSYTFNSTNNELIILNDLSRFLNNKIQSTNLYPENIKSYIYLGSISIFSIKYNLFAYIHKRTNRIVADNLICNKILD
jgi:hypothetical protein